jgi:hypothetical protein
MDDPPALSSEPATEIAKNVEKYVDFDDFGEMCDELGEWELI